MCALGETNASASKRRTIVRRWFLFLLIAIVVLLVAFCCPYLKALYSEAAAERSYNRGTQALESGDYDLARKGERLSGTSIYRLLRAYGLKRPHGLRYIAITEAFKAARAVGLGVEDARGFSRRADVRTLMVDRDGERNDQGQLSALLAPSV